MLEWFGVDSFVDVNDFLKLVVRLAMNLAFVLLIVRCYVRLHERRDFAFSCLLLNVITFSVCILLRKVPVELGFALGLFGVFGILRYRTEPISMGELTYLFVAIGLAMLNAIANKRVSLAELLFINFVIVAATVWAEYAPLTGRKETRVIVYDNLELLKPGMTGELLADLHRRTGLTVQSYRIDDVDLLRDAARITVTCAGAAMGLSRKESRAQTASRLAPSVEVR